MQIGAKHSEKSKAKMSATRTGHLTSLETRRKISEAHKGMKYGDEFKEKIRKARANQKITPKMREALLKHSNGENHFNWKGDEVGYRALHRWIEGKRGKPHYCEHCKRDDKPYREYHWANVSGEYKRDVSDFIRLCATCHKKYDKN